MVLWRKEVSVVMLVKLITVSDVPRRSMSGRQRRCRGGGVSGHVGGTNEVCHLSVRYTRSAAAVCDGSVGSDAGGTDDDGLTFLGSVCQYDRGGVMAEESVDTPVKLMRRFAICRCDIAGRQSGDVVEGSVVGHAGGTDDDV